VATITSVIEAAPPGTYAMVPLASTVGFRGKTMFGLVREPGTIPILSGSIVIPSEQSMAVEATLDANTFNTKQEKGEQMASSKFLDSARFPTITYRSTSIAPIDFPITLNGELTMHGVTKPITLDVETFHLDDDLLHARATGSLLRYDFGMTKGRAVVRDRIAIDLDIIAIKSSEPRY
jgi:polyisoprenoid-binding protein YceI